MDEVVDGGLSVRGTLCRHMQRFDRLANLNVCVVVAQERDSCNYCRLKPSSPITGDHSHSLCCIGFDASLALMLFSVFCFLSRGGGGW